VHGIVADLGGAIDVKSAIGKGLPLRFGYRHDRRRKAVVETVRELPRGRGEIVMIVDDEPTLVELAEEMLAGIGYEPVALNQVAWRWTPLGLILTASTWCLPMRQCRNSWAPSSPARFES